MEAGIPVWVQVRVRGQPPPRGTGGKMDCAHGHFLTPPIFIVPTWGGG